MKKEDDPNARSHQLDDERSRQTLRLAEWVTLTASSVLILAISGYLIFDALQGNDPATPVAVTPLVQEVREADGRFILPVRIENRGRETLRDLKVELSFRKSGVERNTTDLLIDYLGERSDQTAYFYLDEHPRGLDVQARPLSYRLD